MSVKTISRTVVLLSLSAGVFAVQGWAFDNAAHEKLVEGLANHRTARVPTPERGRLK